MVKPCGICNENGNRKNVGLQCGGFCEKFFHGQCLNLSNGQVDALSSDGASWTCASCRRSGVDRRQSFGVGVGVSQSAFTVPQSNPQPTAGTSGTVQGSQIASSDMMAILQALREDMQQMKSELRGLQESVSFCGGKISGFESNLAKFNDCVKKVDRLVTENAQMKTSIESLNAKMNDLDQKARLKNLEILGVPEKNNENLFEVVGQICENLNVNLDQNDIDFVNRVPSNPRYSSNKKFKNIIGRCRTLKVRDNIMNALKLKRTQNGDQSDLSIEGLSNNIYVNEHLTLANKIIHKETRDIAGRKGYKFVWIKNGNIFVRKNETSPILHIKNSESVKKL